MDSWCVFSKHRISYVPWWGPSQLVIEIITAIINVTRFMDFITSRHDDNNHHKSYLVSIDEGKVKGGGLIVVNQLLKSLSCWSNSQVYLCFWRKKTLYGINWKGIQNKIVITQFDSEWNGPSPQYPIYSQLKVNPQIYNYCGLVLNFEPEQGRTRQASSSHNQTRRINLPCSRLQPPSNISELLQWNLHSPGNS